MKKNREKRMKRWAAGLLTVLLVIASNVIPVDAATSGVLVYSVISESVTITDCSLSATGVLEIPSTIEGYPVTTIASYAFGGCSGLTEIIIPSGVTNINTYAFGECSGLTSITIPSTVASIGASAFYGCSSLKEITLPSGITSIGASTFYGCGSLTNFDIPASVTSIGASAFYGCTSLESVSIPKSVTSIGESAFYKCSKLASVDIPVGVTSIGASTFYGCTNLSSVTIPEGVVSIGASAFYKCSNLSNISIPEGVTSIGASAFYGCNSLESINIPEGVTSIEKSTFNGCTSLESVSIPKSVKSIGDFAFSSCDSLTEVIIPDGVTSIGKNTFAYCDNLETVILSNALTSIGNYAFYSCDNLKDMTIPESVTSIGDYTFEESTQVVIHTSSEYVKDYADNHSIKCLWIVDKIEIKQLPNKIDYYLNDEFSSEGLILLVYHGDVTEEVTSGYEVSGFDSSETGNCTITVTYNEQITTFDVTVKERPPLKVSSATIRLENDISVVFKIETAAIDGVYTNPYVVVTQELENGGTKSKSIQGVKSADGVKYEFKYTGVNAKEIGDNIDLTIYAYVGEELVIGETKEDYSVMSYCNTQLAKTASELNMSESKAVAFKTLIVDLVNYASEAQLYFLYKTEAVVRDQLTEEQKMYASADSTVSGLENITNTEYEIIANPTAIWKSAGLNMLSKTTIRLKFQYGGDVSNLKLVAKIANGNKFQVTEIVQAERGTYYVYFDEVIASQFGNAIDFQIVDGNTVISNTLRYSVESYASKKLTDEILGEILSCMMKYGKAANAYNKAE